MAEAMDVSPLPAAEVGPGAVEQGQGGGDVVLPPLLVGHLHRPPVFEPLELLPLPLGLGPGRVSPVARPRSASARGPFRGPPLPHGRTPQPAEQHRQQPERVRGGQGRLPPGPLRRPLDHPGRTHAHRLPGREPPRSAASAPPSGTARPGPSPGTSGRSAPRPGATPAPASRAARAPPPPPSAGVRAGPGPRTAWSRSGTRRGSPRGNRRRPAGRRTWCRPGPARGPCTPGCPSRPESPSGRSRRLAWPGRSR